MDEIGHVSFKEEYDPVTRKVLSISAVEIAPFTVVHQDFLDHVATGDWCGARIDGDLLILELANGTWVYRLGDFYYDHTHKGLTARLIVGGPLTPPR